MNPGPNNPLRSSLALAQTVDERQAPVSLRDTLDAAAADTAGQGSTDAVVTVADGGGQAMPARIGRYIVLRRLGQGGMGVVYSAYDADLDRKVAVKVVREAWQDSSRGRARVMQEAQAMARIVHPNVVHVYEVGQEQQSAQTSVFIAMEFVAGCSLREWQDSHRSSVSLDELVRVYLQAAAGLAAAHRSGLIHRDFKPENVLVGEDGRVRVLDFGLARSMDTPSDRAIAMGPMAQSAQAVGRLTEAGAILGTPGYIAPEQLEGREVDARSDQFSFCVALYEAIYQQLPFAGDSFADYSCSVLAGQLRPPPQRPGGVEVPILIEEVLKRGMSRKPEDRFPSMEALAEALLRGVGSDSDSRRSRRRKRVALLVGCSAILVVISLRVATLAKVSEPQMRHSVLIGWFTCLVALVFGLALHRQIRRQPLLRQGVYFFTVLALYMAIGRTAGLVLDASPLHFHTIELVGMASLCAIEIPHIGWAYLWPTALALLGVLVSLLWPAYALVTAMTVYLLLSVLIAALRPWSASPRAALSSWQSPRT